MRPSSRLSATPDTDPPRAKRRRVRLPSNSDAEDISAETSTQADTTPFRINSDSEPEPTHHTYDTITQVVVDMLELEGPRVSPVHPPVKATQPPVEPSGPSHGGVALAAPTPRETQRRFSSDDEDPPAPVESFLFVPIRTDATLSRARRMSQWSGAGLASASSLVAEEVVAPSAGKHEVVHVARTRSS